tara:strand:+ start:42826 stop:43170 length:345 start_codon:yes stop_codon:yes gene_type:complete
MNITKTASGKKQIKITRKEWTAIGKTAGWMKTAAQQIQGGTFTITVMGAQDARPMGQTNPIVGLDFNYKGESYTLATNNPADLKNLVLDLNEAFAQEIQQMSETQVTQQVPPVA